MFSTQTTVSPFVFISDIISVFVAELEEPEMGISGEGLNKNTILGCQHLAVACFQLNSLLNNKTSDWSKLKAFADDMINVTENFKFVLEWVENIVGKGENAG